MVEYLSYSAILSVLFFGSLFLSQAPSFLKIANWQVSKNLAEFFPCLVLAFVAVRNFILLWYQIYKWNISVEQAQQIANVEPVIEGFTSLFRRYVATRSLAVHAYVWVGWGLLTAIAFFFGQAGPQDNAVTDPVLFIVGLSLINLCLAYFTTNSFKIGEVLVDFLGIIAYRSAHPFQTQFAEQETLHLAQRHRRKHFWWFY
jgi:hypothetical protein